MNPVDPLELLKEKSLFDVYRLGGRIPRKPLYKFVEATTAVALLFWAVTSGKDATHLAPIVREWGDLGFGFATAILGFLLAGFAIFTAIMRMDVALLMASETHEKSGLSYLKYNFVAFVQVFAEYLAFVAVYVFLKLFCMPGGLLSMSLRGLPRYSDEIRMAAALAGIVLIGWFLVHLVVRLQAFVFNVYHVVMTMISLEAARAEGRREPGAGPDG